MRASKKKRTSSISSPTFFSQEEMVPSVIVGDKAGNVITICSGSELKSLLPMNKRRVRIISVKRSVVPSPTHSTQWISSYSSYKLIVI